MITIKHSLINYTHSQPCSIQVKEIEKRVRINLSKTVRNYYSTGE